MLARQPGIEFAQVETHPVVRQGIDRRLIDAAACGRGQDFRLVIAGEQPIRLVAFADGIRGELAFEKGAGVIGGGGADAEVEPVSYGAGIAGPAHGAGKRLFRQLGAAAQERIPRGIEAGGAPVRQIGKRNPAQPQAHGGNDLHRRRGGRHGRMRRGGTARQQQRQRQGGNFFFRRASERSHGKTGRAFSWNRSGVTPPPSPPVSSWDRRRQQGG